VAAQRRATRLKLYPEVRKHYWDIKNIFIYLWYVNKPFKHSWKEIIIKICCNKGFVWEQNVKLLKCWTQRRKEKKSSLSQLYTSTPALWTVSVEVNLKQTWSDCRKRCTPAKISAVPASAHSVQLTWAMSLSLVCFYCDKQHVTLLDTYFTLSYLLRAYKHV